MSSVAYGVKKLEILIVRNLWIQPHILMNIFLKTRYPQSSAFNKFPSSGSDMCALYGLVSRNSNNWIHFISFVKSSITTGQRQFTVHENFLFWSFSNMNSLSFSYISVSFLFVMVLVIHLIEFEYLIFL